MARPYVKRHDFHHDKGSRREHEHSYSAGAGNLDPSPTRSVDSRSRHRTHRSHRHISQSPHRRHQHRRDHYHESEALHRPTSRHRARDTSYSPPGRRSSTHAKSRSLVSPRRQRDHRQTSRSPPHRTPDTRRHSPRPRHNPDRPSQRHRHSRNSISPQPTRRAERDRASRRGSIDDDKSRPRRGRSPSPRHRRSHRRHEAADGASGEAMYGHSGHPRGYYNDPRYPNYPNTPQYPSHAQPPYGRGGYAQQYPAYASHQGSPHGHSYAQQQQPYYGYPHSTAHSPYYPTHPSPAYTQQPAYPHSMTSASPPARPPPVAAGPRASGPPLGAQKTKGGHFANLSWTPNNHSKAVEPTDGATVVDQEASVDDDDNPFRPPRDLRAEDESEKRSVPRPPSGPAIVKKDSINFSIKGFADKKATPSAPVATSSSNGTKSADASFKSTEPAKPRAAVRMIKETVTKKRLKPRPLLSTEHAQSDSIYYRKTGNESVVGSGTYGKVYKAIHVYTKDEVALKKIRMEGEKDGFPVTAIREIKLLQSLHHPNIVALQEVMVENNDCFMVFEYLQHDLTGLLNHPTFTLTDAHKKHLAKQMFDGLDYLHRRGVLHRDIKAANILVSKTGQLKFADFGLARFYQRHKKRDHTNRVITIWYRPPELLLGETQYGAAVDIWSAACVLVEILTRHAIFPGDGSELNQLDKIYSVLGTPSRSAWPSIVEMQWYELLRPATRIPSRFGEKYKEKLTPAAFELLEAMFQYDPDKRPSAADVLEHPYFMTEEPAPVQATELANVEGDWHEFESKALRKEKDREERKRREREKVAAAGEKRQAEQLTKEGERESKRIKMASSSEVDV